MKNTIAALIITLFVFHPLAARTIAQQQQNDNAKSEELKEANRLSAQTVELYKKQLYDEGIALARRSLEIRERALGLDDALVGDALQNLASLYFAKKDFDQAISLSKRAVAIYEKGAQPSKLASSLDTLGWFYYAEGDKGKAEETFHRSLAIREKSLGSGHRDTAISLQLLAQFNQKEAKYAIATDYYKRALAVLEKELGPNHKTVGELSMKCACAMGQEGQSKEAMDMRKRAEKILEGPVGSGAAFEGQITKSKAISRTEPRYPPAAKQARIAGSVIVEILMDEAGKVIQAQPLCGPDQLIAPSVEAALKWQFTPTLLNGHPVKAIGIIQFHFSLWH